MAEVFRAYLPRGYFCPPTIIIAEHRSRMPLGSDVRPWLKYYSRAKRSNPTSQIVGGKHRCCLPLCAGMGEW